MTDFGLRWPRPYGGGGGGATLPIEESDVTGLVDDLAALEAEIATKADASHTHPESDITGLVSDLADLASDIAGKSDVGHTHPESDITSLVADLAAKAPTSRMISTTAPLQGGGSLAADRTLSVDDATTSAKGVVKLAGDLGGTAALPTVPGLATKQDKLARVTTTITTSALDDGDSYSFTVAAGAVSLLLKAVANLRAWLRLYATDADRTADASRTIDQDASTAILLDALFYNGGLTLPLWRVGGEAGISAVNGDSPVANDLYGKITLPVGGRDLLYDALPGTGIADTDLSGLAPTDPYSSGVTAWEYTGSAGRYLRWYLGGVVCASGATNNNLARYNHSFNHSDLEMWADFYHLGTDGAADSTLFCFYIPNTAIGSYNDREVLRIGLVRSGSGAGTPTIAWVDSSGTYTVLATGTAISHGLNGGVRIYATIDGTTAYLYKADYLTGASKSLVCSAAIPSALKVTNHDYVGVYATRNTGASGYTTGPIHVRNGTTQAVVLDLTYLKLETA